MLGSLLALFFLFFFGGREALEALADFLIYLGSDFVDVRARLVFREIELGTKIDVRLGAGLRQEGRCDQKKDERRCPQKNRVNQPLGTLSSAAAPS